METNTQRHTQTHTHKHTDTHTHIPGDTFRYTCTETPTYVYTCTDIHTQRPLDTDINIDTQADTHTSSNFNWCPLPCESQGHCVEQGSYRTTSWGEELSETISRSHEARAQSWANWFKGLNSKLPSSASRPPLQSCALTGRRAQGCKQEAKSSVLRLYDLGESRSLSEYWFPHR